MVRKLRLMTSIVVLGLIVCGCSRSTFVLLPDTDGSVGEIRVVNQMGERVLNQPGQSVSMSGYSKPGAVTVVDNTQIDTVFAEAMRIQPLPPAKFTLYFQFDSTRLRNTSYRVFEQILETIRERESMDISVNGHTDRAGATDYNYTLSLHRADYIADKLVKSGIAREYIITTYHGEGNPLIPTPDDKLEPRNRRVEVIVR